MKSAIPILAAVVAALTLAATAPALGEVKTVEQAALAGWISQYATWYDRYQYKIVGANEIVSFPAWTGFWVAVKQGVDLLIPAGVLYSTSLPDPISLDLDNYRWYLISAPVNPGGAGDVYINLGALSGGRRLLYDDYKGYPTDRWRVYKWKWDTGAYHHYWDGSFETLIPGRGFFVKQMYEDHKDINLSGSKAALTGSYYELKLPHGSTTWTHHMVGNPFWYGIMWKDCMVRSPTTGTPPVGKTVAVASLADAEMWHVQLGVRSLDGPALDTYNRAGVVMTEGISSEFYCAPDMEPPGEYVRLSVKDPLDPDRGTFAYDYRQSGQDEYVWKVDLTTTYPQVNAKFSLTGFAQVPREFGFTLEGPETGQILELTGDDSLDVTLSSGSTQTFVLTAAAKPTKVEEESAKPSAFGIVGVRPNPFNSSTVISFGLAGTGNATVQIYSVSGQLLQTLVQGVVSAGTHHVVWDAEGIGSGVYVVLVESGAERDAAKIVLIR